MSSLNVSVLWIIFQLWFFVNLGLSWLSWCSEAKGWKKIKQWPFLCYRRVIPVSASQGWSREKSTRVYLYNRRYWAEQASCLYINFFSEPCEARSARRERWAKAIEWEAWCTRAKVARLHARIVLLVRLCCRNHGLLVLYTSYFCFQVPRAHQRRCHSNVWWTRGQCVCCRVVYRWPLGIRVAVVWWTIGDK